MATGTIFSTANSTVATLPAGSTLKVLGDGKIQVTSVPVVTFNEGDKVYVASKNRLGRIVRMTDRVGSVNGFSASTQVLYVADGTSVVRVANKSDVKKLA